MEYILVSISSKYYLQIHFLLHRTHTLSPLQRQIPYSSLRNNHYIVEYIAVVMQ
jgi:hypothetical protein